MCLIDFSYVFQNQSNSHGNQINTFQNFVHI